MNSGETTRNEYQAFREDRHETFKTSQEVLEQVILNATGSKIADEARIVAGETNEVFAITAENGQELILRIFHGPKTKFERERWAIEQCAKTGVPVPEVLLVESLSENGEPLQICVETKLSGTGLADVTSMGNSIPPDARLLNQLGGILEKIHAVPTNGFGSLDKGGNGKYKTAKDMLLHDQNISREKILPEDEKILFDREIVEQAKNTLDREAGKFPEVRPFLIHGDLSPQHILVSEGKISGLIDFEHAKGSDPAEEFARWELKFGDKFPLKDIIDGHKNQAFFSGDFEWRKNVWRLFQGLAILSYCLREKKYFALDRTVKKLAETLKYFEH